MLLNVKQKQLSKMRIAVFHAFFIFVSLPLSHIRTSILQVHDPTLQVHVPNDVRLPNSSDIPPTLFYRLYDNKYNFLCQK